MYSGELLPESLHSLGKPGQDLQFVSHWTPNNDIILTSGYAKGLENTHIEVATVRGGWGSNASLLVWHHRLGHPSFKMVINLSKSGVSSMTLMDVPAVIPSLNTCTACVAGKSVHLPHKEGYSRATEFLEHVHIDIAGLTPVASSSGCHYIYVVMDDYSCAVYSHLLHLKLEAFDAFKMFKAVVENELGRRIHKVMTNNT